MWPVPSSAPAPSAGAARRRCDRVGPNSVVNNWPSGNGVRRHEAWAGASVGAAHACALLQLDCEAFCLGAPARFSPRTSCVWLVGRSGRHRLGTEWWLGGGRMPSLVDGMAVGDLSRVLVKNLRRHRGMYATGRTLWPWPSRSWFPVHGVSTTGTRVGRYCVSPRYSRDLWAGA
jgi:hypothetical protein